MTDLTRLDPHELRREYGRVLTAIATPFERETPELRRELNAIVAECRRRDDHRITTAQRGQALFGDAR